MTVVSLRPDLELDEFFSFMWDGQKGFVYSPLKSPGEEEQWETKFFAWPQQKQELISHVLDNTDQFEVYYGPALYKTPSNPVQDNILGSNVLWAEFDGNTPSSGVLGDKIPQPSMRIRSSNEGHEHLYWKLDNFETDRIKIETVNKTIAYTLQADTSGWDATQILRPPGTNNHKRDKVVRVISSSTSCYSYEFFSNLEVPKQLAKEDIVLEEIPEALSVIAKYKWDTEDFLFFRKTEMATGVRSSALMRLAFTCAEMRMSDEEAFAILYNADSRWKKFSHRKDQTKRLLDLINRARHKYPVNPELVVDELPVYNWQELLDLEIHVDWLINGVLERQGLMIVSGAPGAGKTQLTLQALMHMAMGKPFLQWEMKPARKVCFFSMEMGPAQLKFIMEQMNEVLTEEERALLKHNFMFIPIGHGIMFESPTDRKRIEQFLSSRKPECIVFDSLSVTSMDELSNEGTAKKIMDISAQLRMEYNVSIIFIHHNRKAQVGNKKPTALSDIYGSYHLTAQATTVLGMWRNKSTNEIELSWLKVRFAEEPPQMNIIRTEGLNFKEVSPVAIMNKAKEAANADIEQESPLDKFRPKGL